MNEDLHKILLILAQRHIEKKDPSSLPIMSWFSMVADTYKPNGYHLHCYLCNEAFDNDVSWNGWDKIESHGIKHLKEYGLISYL
jgi:hypothetical protein